MCDQKLVAEVFFESKDPCVAGICYQGEPGFMREPVSWLTNHPLLALEQWRENTSGAEPDRPAQVKNGLASARYLVELVESFLRVVPEDVRGARRLSGIFVSDVRGVVLEAARVNKQDEKKSNGVVTWAFWSPSFVRTWMQMEVKRCPYIGLTLTRATRIDPTTGLVWSCERSRRP